MFRHKLQCDLLVVYDLKGTGALEQSKIKVDLPDDEIHSFLQSCIHQSPPCTEVVEDADTGLPDQCLQECCGSSPVAKALRNLVVNLSDALAERKLRAGTLLTFNAEFSHTSVCCFLGVTLQRPIMQTLMHVNLASDGSAEFVYEDGISTAATPKITTSAQTFMAFITEYQNSPDGPGDPECSGLVLKLDIWHHSVKWVHGHRLVAVVDNLVGSLPLKAAERTSRNVPRAAAKLPLGLKPPRKKRTQAQKRKPKQKQDHSEKGSARKQLEDPGGGHGHDSDMSEKEDGGSSASEGEGQLDMNKESEPVDPVSETARLEEKEEKRLKEDIDRSNQLKAAVSEQYHSGKLPTGKTFFSRELGVDGVGPAASSRSVCLFCKLKINKGDIRYSWYYSCLRPHGWVHSHCLYQMATTSGLKEQTVKKLEEFSNRASGSGGPDASQKMSTELLTVFQS